MNSKLPIIPLFQYSIIPSASPIPICATLAIASQSSSPSLTQIYYRYEHRHCNPFSFCNLNRFTLDQTGFLTLT
jgi:hypothetical protein